MNLEHIGFKLILTDANGIQQLDFINKKIYSVPKQSGQVHSTNMQLAPPNFFRWGTSRDRLCKLFLKNYGSEDVQFKVNPRDDYDGELVGELDANDHRDIDFLTVGAIKKLNIKVMGPGSTTIRIDGYILSV
jgi:hypothetical protein